MNDECDCQLLLSLPLSNGSPQVGLGNVWRFPFTAYENGGGAFLIPYLVVLIMIGRPLYFMELSLGQFSSSSNVKVRPARDAPWYPMLCWWQVWNMVPAARGVGFAQVIGTSSVVSYYCVLIALSIYYLVASCQATLPWTVCWEELKVGGICSLHRAQHICTNLFSAK